MKRIVVLLLSVVVVGFAFSAGQNGGAAEPVEIVYWTHDFAPIVETVGTLIPEYEAANPGVKIEYINFPWTEFETALATFLATGEGPDIFGSGDRMTANWVKAGLIAPVEYKLLGYNSLKDMEADFAPGSLGTVSVKGVPYGPHIEHNTEALYINTAHYEEVGLNPDTDYPKSWNELAKVAKKLAIVDSGGDFIREGLDFNYTGDTDCVYFVIPIMAQFGATVFNNDNSECLLNSSGAIEAFKMMQSLVYDSKVGTPKAGGLDPYFSQQDFIEEQTSMMLGMNWVEPTLEGKPIADHYKVVPMPQLEGGDKSTFAYSWYWAVNANSEKQDDGWKLIDFLSSNQLLWYKNSRFIQPRHPQWMDTPEANAAKTPYFDLFVESMEYAKTAIYITNYTDYYQAIWRAFQAVMYDNADVAKTLNTAKSEVDAAIATWK
jgi:ABC-type glycerol-3-phosphate transport system substrate-binding protein